MSEMFPAEGERKPKRRFPGFTDDWKQRELGKVLGNLTDGDWIEKEHISDKGKYRIIQTGNIGIGEYYNKGKDAKFLNQSSFDVLNGNEIFPGDILISRLAEPAGRTIILPNTGSRMVTAVDVAIVRPNSNFSSYFIQTMMNTNETLKKINEEASGSTRKRISRKNLELIDLIIPEIQEQEKIGNFFKNLDQTIAFQQQKLEKLQNIKKAYLNEMFI
ncbi:restriction endonuclease subunit M [Lactococcus lactis]|nr:restriction endonuclease subunit M [Lactococcus lactis]